MDTEVPDLDEIMGNIAGGGSKKSSPLGGGGRRRKDPFDDIDNLGDDGLDDLLAGDDMPDFDDLDGLMGDQDEDRVPRVFSGPRPQKKKGGMSRVLTILIIILLAIWAVAIPGYLFRDAILAMVPQTKVIYDVLNLSSGGSTPLTIANAKAQVEKTETGPVMTLYGLVVNKTDQEQQIPPLVLRLKDANNDEVRRKVIDPPQATIPPNGQVPYETTIEVPSDNSVTSWEVGLHFDPKDE